ncbi:DUF1992 domain-containing protein [Antribacter sp. KLBMP9083]|uniref:DUF1992 domain-containing protein n=1 Tax=Antribacter soli TaxID=2910976 RepID=A0AA41U8H1_9MICO|nr:DUF1992 domain-containing protein [Antribacter soli]MCF4120482.1 DUF1992 domain-containing protein [Antribacter soli]
MDERSRYVDTVIDQAIRRGEFDNLPLHGKPIPSLKSGAHDPDWWLKNLVEREQITGVLPSAQLRKDDAELDEALDREAQEERVREIVEEFNARVIDARRQLLGGPPVVTPTRDVDQEVARWRQRRATRRAARSGPDSKARTDRTDRAAGAARTADAGASPSRGRERPASDRRGNPDLQTTSDRATSEKKPWWRPW